MGDTAERLVEARLRDALPAGARLYANVRFVAKTRPGGPAHDGEADIVILDPENGLLVVEVKGGEPTRDAHGTWWLGQRKLERSPFEQAEAAKRDLAAAIEALPGWPTGRELRRAHAVAFPTVDLASLPRGHVLLGPDAPRDIVLDAEALADAAAARRALDRAFALWVGDGARGHPMTDQQLALADEYLAPTVALHRLVKRDVDDDRSRLVRASQAQLLVLNQHRTTRRLEIVGPAGSGKSLVAVEKARRLAREGWRTLFVCFNQPLATSVLRAVEDDDLPLHLRPTVTTFHRLAETMAAAAGILPPKPSDPGSDWFDGLPRLLDQAIRAPDADRFEAIVIDEGQDFEPEWLLSLEMLLQNPDDDILWVFHDPGQALYRDDRVGELGLERIELFEDWRSPAPVAGLAAAFYRGPGEPYPMDEAGRAPVIVAAEPGAQTVDAVRRQLHHLVEEEGVRAWDIVVLSGGSAPKSDVWRQRRFGNLELWNGAIDAEGRSRGLPADEIPPEPKDGGVVLFESVRRFKGLERPVVVLCELPTDGDRLDQLLYTALTRATTHLVVVVPPELAQRLHTVERDSAVTRGGVA